MNFGDLDRWITEGNRHQCDICGEAYTDSDGGCWRCQEAWCDWLARVLASFSTRELTAIAEHDGVLERRSEDHDFDWPEGYRLWTDSQAEGVNYPIDRAQGMLLAALREAFNAAQAEAEETP